MDRTSRESETYNGKWRWHEGQPVTYDGSPEEVARQYLKDAQERIDPFQDVIDELAQRLPSSAEIIPACVKPEDSTLRKVWDRTTRYKGKPHLMTDFLRATGVVPASERGIPHLVDTINWLIDHPLLAGYKDQFYEPNDETGFRSFKALMMIDGHKAELLIKYGGMKEADDYTNMVRDLERSFRDNANRLGEGTDKHIIDSTVLHRFGAHVERGIGLLRSIRHAVSDEYAERCGLNVLLSENIAAEKQKISVHDIWKSAGGLIRNNYFGHKIEPVLTCLPELSLRLH